MRSQCKPGGVCSVSVVALTESEQCYVAICVRHLLPPLHTHNVRVSMAVAGNKTVALSPIIYTPRYLTFQVDTTTARLIPQ